MYRERSNPLRVRFAFGIALILLDADWYEFTPLVEPDLVSDFDPFLSAQTIDECARRKVIVEWGILPLHCLEKRFETAMNPDCRRKLTWLSRT